jgi:DNA-binding response OmpR family regulator
MTGQPLIVIADANPELLAMMSQELSRRGFEVVTVTDGQRALDTIRERLPAAAVLEWVMPTLQGPRVCAQLKSVEETADIPVVLLTARAAEADIASGFDEGADDYLTKPFAIDELNEMLWRLISERR